MQIEKLDPFMEWNVERIHLSQTKSLLNRNSQLKKKISLVKKLKNLQNESLQPLLEDLSTENMEQFFSEIIDSILSLKVTCLEDIKNIIRIISIYLKDHKFINMLFTHLNSTEIYWHKIIFIEIQILTDTKFNYKLALKSLFNDASNLYKIFYMEYVLYFFNDEKLIAFINKEKTKIGQLDMNQIDDKYSERVLNICRVLNIDIIEQKSDNNFKQVIELKENEFDFYTCKFLGEDNFTIPRQTKDIVEILKSNKLDIGKIDAISKYLRKTENVKMIPVIYNKLKNNIFCMPVLARIIRNCGILCKKSINKLLEDVFENKITNRTDLINTIFLVSELIKFRYIGFNECFNLLEYFYKQKDIETCCLLMKNVGRFLLVDEQSNNKARNFLDKLIAYGNKCSSIECTHINDMLSVIFSKSVRYESEDNIYNFLSYHFKNGVHKTGSKIDLILKKNKKYFLKILCAPWKFKDVELVCKIASLFCLDLILIDLLPFIIELIGNSYKLKTFSYTKFLSGLLKCKNSKIQETAISSLFNIKIHREMKLRILIVLLSGMSFCVKSRHIQHLKNECSKVNTIEIHNMLFNLCESIGVKYEKPFYEDSFDEEIRLMENL